MNFDTAAGEGGKREVLQAATGCNRLHVVVSLFPFTIEYVTLWRADSTVAVEK